MAFKIPIELERTFEVGCGYDEAFSLLADVPRSVSHFPDVEQLVDLGNNTFRWKMAKSGIGSYSVQVTYACSYTDDRERGRVEWAPVEGEGNSWLEGHWNLERETADDAVRIEFFTRGELKVDLPALGRLLLSPLVVAEFRRLVERYHANLQEALSG